MDNIKKLEEIVPKLSEAPTGALPLKVFTLEGGGECPIWSVFQDGDEVGVVQAYMPGGTSFPKHTHDEFEVLIPYRGTLAWEGREYGPGKVLYIYPNTPHVVVAKEDCWMIGVTVPFSPGYPDGR